VQRKACIGALAAATLAAFAPVAIGPAAAENSAHTTAAAAAQPVDAAQASQKVGPLTLTEPEKQAILKAVEPQDTHDKLPDGFQGQVGAKVPTQKKLPVHPLPQSLFADYPALKEYRYAKLDRQVLIIDPGSVVVAAIPR
jgi:hypothetical protein